MDRIADAFQNLADDLAALAAAIRPPAPTVVVSPPRRPLLRRVVRPTPRPFQSWPDWGTLHVMTCTRQGCFVCARLERTVEYVGHPPNGGYSNIRP